MNFQVLLLFLVVANGRQDGSKHDTEVDGECLDVTLALVAVLSFLLGAED